MNYIKIVKLAVGFYLAVVTASHLGLAYSTSAGVITLLTIQNTKKETLLVTGKRYAAFLLALGIAAICLPAAGYRAVGLGVFLLFFAAACSALSMQEALAMNAVLVTHFFAEQSMSFYWLRNEALLLLIGSGIGVLLNLYIPSNKKQIRKVQEEIEEDIRRIFENMAVHLLEESKIDYPSEAVPDLEKKLGSAHSKAYANLGNTLLTDTRYYIQYMDMRIEQCRVLRKMEEDVRRIRRVPEQTYPVVGLFRHIIQKLHEYNNVKDIMVKFERVLEQMKREELPATREEFENRAVLYHLLIELEEFLLLKRAFVEKLTQEQVKKFWDGRES